MYLFKTATFLFYLLVSDALIFTARRLSSSGSVDCMDVPGICLQYQGVAMMSAQSQLATYNIILPDFQKLAERSQSLNFLLTSFNISGREDLQASLSVLSHRCMQLNHEFAKYEVQSTDDVPAPAPSSRNKRFAAAAIIGGTIFGLSSLASLITGGAAMNAVRHLRADLQTVSNELNDLTNQMNSRLVSISQELNELSTTLDRSQARSDLRSTILSESFGLTTAAIPNMTMFHNGLKQLFVGDVPVAMIPIEQWRRMITKVENSVRQRQQRDTQLRVLKDPKVVGVQVVDGVLQIAFEFLVSRVLPGHRIYKVIPIPLVKELTHTNPQYHLNDQPTYILTRGQNDRGSIFAPHEMSKTLKECPSDSTDPILSFDPASLINTRSNTPCGLFGPAYSCTDLILFKKVMPHCSADLDSFLLEKSCMEETERLGLMLIPLAEGRWYVIIPGDLKLALWEVCVDVSRILSTDCTRGCIVTIKCGCDVSLQTPTSEVAQTLTGDGRPCDSSALSRGKRAVKNESEKPTVFVSDYGYTPPRNTIVRQAALRPTAATKRFIEPLIISSQFRKTHQSLKTSSTLQNVFSGAPLTIISTVVSGIIAAFGVLTCAMFCCKRVRALSTSAILLRTVQPANALGHTHGIAETTSLVFLVSGLMTLLVLVSLWLLYRHCKNRVNTAISQNTPYAGYGQLVSRNLTDIVNKCLPVLTGTDLLPVNRYPHWQNMALKRIAPNNSCLIILLLKGNATGQGTIQFTTGIQDITCSQRQEIESIQFKGHGTINLTYDLETNLLRGELYGVHINMKHDKKDESLVVKFSFCRPRISVPSVFEIQAAGVRCITCGGCWISIIPFVRVYPTAPSEKDDVTQKGPSDPNFTFRSIM